MTDHPGHVCATEAALAAAEILDVSVYAWAIEGTVVGQLGLEFGTTFAGIEREETAVVLHVDRTAQYRGIKCQRNQLRDNAVLHRRLALQRDEERLLQLRDGCPWRPPI